MPRIVLLGAPGSGKSTKSAVLCARYGIPEISSGDALRANLQAGTPLGLEAKRYMEAGELVPDNIIIAFVDGLIEKADTQNGFLLDGFPRTTKQAQELDRLLAKRGAGIDNVFNLNAPVEVLLERIANRQICTGCGAIYNLLSKPPREAGVCDICGTELTIRKDDVTETVRKRIEVYGEFTRPLIEYYKNLGLLVEIDATTEIEDQVSIMTSAIDEA